MHTNSTATALISLLSAQNTQAQAASDMPTATATLFSSYILPQEGGTPTLINSQPAVPAIPKTQLTAQQIAAIDDSFGDINGDGIVNGADLAVLATEYNQSGSNLAGDLNGDGTVNQADLAVVKKYFNQNVSGLEAQAQAAAEAALSSGSASSATVTTSAPGATATAVPAAQPTQDLSAQQIAAINASFGDITGSGTVNIVDFNIVASQYGKSGAGLTGDLNGDGTVDQEDVAIIQKYFGQNVRGLETAAYAAAEATKTVTPPVAPSQAAIDASFGDITGSGTVNIVDFNIVASQYGKSGTGLTGDLNGDGTVDQVDVAIIQKYFGQNVSGLEAAAYAAAQAAYEAETSASTTTAAASTTIATVATATTAIASTVSPVMSASTSIDDSLGDLNGDGIVNSSDLLIATQQLSQLNSSNAGQAGGQVMADTMAVARVKQYYGQNVSALETAAATSSPVQAPDKSIADTGTTSTIIAATTTTTTQNHLTALLETQLPEYGIIANAVSSGSGSSTASLLNINALYENYGRSAYDYLSQQLFDA